MEWVWTATRLKTLADILLGLGHVLFASVAIPFFFDEFNLLVAALGFIFALAFWIASLIVLGEDI